MKMDVFTYEGLKNCVTAFKKGTFNVLFIIGSHGQSKTTMVKAVLGEHETRGPRYIKGGSISAFDLFIELQSNMDTGRDFVLDDADGLYHDPKAIRLLKALCETEKVKKIGWYTHHQLINSGQLRKEFETKSRVVIILNHWATLDQQIEALEDRGLMVFFRPSVDEVLASGRKWFKDREILQFVEQHKFYIQHLSLRAMLVAKEMKDAGLGDHWKAALRDSLGISELVMVHQLLKDPGFLSDMEREREFRHLTAKDGKPGLGRGKWFALKRHLEDLTKQHETTRPHAPIEVLDGEPVAKPKARPKGSRKAAKGATS